MHSAAFPAPLTHSVRYYLTNNEINSMADIKNKIGFLLKEKYPSESEYLHFLVLVRKILEQLRESNLTEYNNFENLKLFCDWALHIVIDRSSAGSSLIVNINKSLKNGKKGHTDDLIKAVSDSLVGKFKLQLKNFLIMNQLSTDIVDDDNRWRDLLKNTLEIITEIPVILKPKHEDTVKGDSLKEGMWAKEVSIVKVNLEKLAGNQFDSNKETYCLLVLTSDTTRLVIPITPGG